MRTEVVLQIKLASTNQCTGCSACASICPTKSIAMIEDNEGFLQPRIDADTCIKCHKCEKTCPVITQKPIPTDVETQAYAAINKDETIRMRSSSGGMFYALAKWTIEQGGVVFGARFDEKWDVIHDHTETIKGIEPFMRSKYVQSRIGATYRQAKGFLKSGRQVLFVGTPCQIGGLYTYLGEKYESLITVDFICHGIPSPGVWRQYRDELFKGEKIVSYNFRNKESGWIPQHCKIEVVTNQRNISTNLLENPYFRGFRKDVYLRRSCYECHYRNYHRISDFTIADYWGVDEKCPSMYDNRGTSVVFVHTLKAGGLLKELAHSIIIKAQTKEDAISGNRGMDSENPVWSPYKRRLFYKTLKHSSFRNAINKIDRCLEIEDWLRKQPKKIQRKLKKIFR